MPARCTFLLNTQRISTLMCDGTGYAADYIMQN